MGNVFGRGFESLQLHSSSVHEKGQFPGELSFFLFKPYLEWYESYRMIHYYFFLLLPISIRVIISSFGNEPSGKGPTFKSKFAF